MRVVSQSPETPHVIGRAQPPAKPLQGRRRGIYSILLQIDGDEAREKVHYGVMEGKCAATFMHCEEYVSQRAVE